MQEERSVLGNLMKGQGIFTLADLANELANELYC
jgi:hypothetical protein